MRGGSLRAEFGPEKTPRGRWIWCGYRESDPDLILGKDT